MKRHRRNNNPFFVLFLGKCCLLYFHLFPIGNVFLTILTILFCCILYMWLFNFVLHSWIHASIGCISNCCRIYCSHPSCFSTYFFSFIQFQTSSLPTKLQVGLLPVLCGYIWNWSIYQRWALFLHLHNHGIFINNPTRQTIFQHP